MIGKTISHYKIVEKLGGGGMGVVYKAEDTKLKRTVALKFLSPAFSFDKEAKKRFINEAQTASSLQQHNICTIHDIDETEDGQIFICMDCYDGETLKEKIESGQIKTEEAIDIIFQVATGLQKAHERGIIHRDIKPANIFIANDGVVKILDFGLSKLSGQTMITKMGAPLGTIAYMSPEQARGEKVDHRTDIWSLGVVLYEMLTGKRPFAAEYEQAVIYSILNEAPKIVTDLRSDIPIEIEKVVTKCLSKNPLERYQSIDEFLEYLQVSGGREERSKTGTFSFVKKNKSRKVIYISLAIVILGVLSVSLWKYFQHGTSQSEVSKFIAVLPFHPITNSEEDKSFAEGMHDDILTQLTKIQELKVIARTSVMQYQNTKKTIKEIADELGVGVILEGSTRRSGNKIRITAQLIDAKSEQHLWADSYDRQYSDIFAVQTDVAEKVANELKAVLSSNEKKLINQTPTKNMAAYDYYLKGQQYWLNSNDIEGNKLAAQMFEKAVELDSTFALAYAKLSTVYSTLYTPEVFDQGEIHRKKAEDALKKAESLNPELPDVYFARANYFSVTSSDRDKAVTECKKALMLSPNNSEYIFWIGNMILDKGNVDEALGYFLKSFDLNPNGYQEGHYISYIYILKRNWDEAEKWIDDYLPKHPGNSIGYVRKAEIKVLGYGDLNEARTILEEGEYKGRWVGQLIPTLWLIEIYSRNYKAALEKNELDPSFPSYRARKIYTLELLGRKHEAKSLYDSLRTTFEKRLITNPNSVDIYNALAFIYAGLGMKDEAIHNALKAVELSHYNVDNNFLMQLPSEPNYRLLYVYIKVGEYEKALDEIERLLSLPYRFTKWNLRLDPLYDPLRNMPRFKKLANL